MSENLSGKTKNYEVIEDNGGGLTLVVFGTGGKVEYIHSGYEYGTNGNLLADLESLKNGADPLNDWDGNCGGQEWEFGNDPQALYDNITSYEYGWKIVADSNGMYSEKMGSAACREFDINQE